MSLLFTIGLRNLLRQRRRSFLLGLAIAFGTAVLVIANAFSHGISEVFFNELLGGWTGHISLYFTNNGDSNNSIFHDADHIRSTIKACIPDVKRIDEIVGIQTRAIGNGKADMFHVVGLPLTLRKVGDEELFVLKNFNIIEGSFDALVDSTIKNPVGLAVKRARSLNVRLNDVVRIRYFDKHGQNQATHLTVAAIFEPTNFIWGAFAIMDVERIKRLAGFGENDIANLYISIDNPKKRARQLADSLHAGLQPPLAVIDGKLSVKDSALSATLLAMRTDSASRALLNASIKMSASLPADTMINSKSVIVSRTISSSYSLFPGDTCTFTYNGKFDNAQNVVRLIIRAVADSGCGIDGNTILVNEKDLYRIFYNSWPESSGSQSGPFRPDTSTVFYKALGREWILSERPHSTDEYVKLNREIVHNRGKATVITVGSMYETASVILNLEIVLNLISFVFVMLLFFIILIGVINTLRMTIRERTREIGAMRAIGMQRIDVRNLFLIETGMLAFFSSIAGTTVALCVTRVLSQLSIDIPENPFSMLLIDKHLVFSPTPGSILFFITLIESIALITAYFPAKRAAKLTPGEAFRHFE